MTGRRCPIPCTAVSAVASPGGDRPADSASRPQVQRNSLNY